MGHPAASLACTRSWWVPQATWTGVARRQKFGFVLGALVSASTRRYSLVVGIRVEAMETYSIRLAEPGDAEAIAHVHVLSWRTTYAGLVPKEYLDSLRADAYAQLWKEWLARDVRVFVAERDGEIVGFAGGGPIRESLADYDAELYTIYLLEEVQGQGIGRRLLRAVAEGLVGRSLESMIVWVLEENAAVRFYERMGAEFLARKQIEIGGASLTEIALGWRELRRL